MKFFVVVTPFKKIRLEMSLNEIVGGAMRTTMWKWWT